MLMALVMSAAGAIAAPVARADQQTFSFTGSEQSFLVPPRVTVVHIAAVGGHGGSLWAAPGGAGAVASADVPVTPGTTLYVEVGGNGADVAAGGFNGGGNGGSATPASGVAAAGGGGASDVRALPASQPDSLVSRLLVAAGGGGSAFWRAGAAAGTGVADLWSGQAGTASSGGAGGLGTYGGLSGQSGSLGSGGAGGQPGYLGTQMGGGGGGSGLFGGGGGGGGGGISNQWGSTQNPGGAGGGGSSGFAATASNTSVGLDATGTPVVTLSYVIPPPPTLTVTAVRARASGVIELRARISGPGRLSTTASAKRIVYGRPSHKVVEPGTAKLTIQPRAAALRLLRKDRRLKVTITTTFTPPPTAGDPVTRTTHVVVKLHRQSNR